MNPIKAFTKIFKKKTELKEEYKIELTKEHFQGNRMKPMNCIGARALIEAMGRDLQGRKVHWFTTLGHVHKGYDVLTIFGAYNSNGDCVNIMNLTEQDIGTMIYFRKIREG